MQLTVNQQAFLALLRAGLWEHSETTLNLDVNLNEEIDWEKVFQSAEEQTVIGVVLAGVENFNTKPPQKLLLQWIGKVQILEKKNRAMNHFIANLIEKLRKLGVYTILVKGQGIAQCYDRPLWRSCGDVDLFLSSENLHKAKSFLLPLASRIGVEDAFLKHVPLTINNWEVELHGSLRSGLWRDLDNTLDKVQYDVFYKGNVRSWINGDTQVFLPGIDEDIVFVFAHILQHFFKSGIGLRQLCDWCRLLWVFRDSIDLELLRSRLNNMGVMSEWQAFSSLAVNYLGMPVDAMPFYMNSSKNKEKGDRILNCILETGNFGHNRDFSYYERLPFIVGKAKSLWRYTCDATVHFFIFPKDSLKVWGSLLINGIYRTFKGV